MPIEILQEEYEILELLTNGMRLLGVQPGLQYEFISPNGTRTQADCLTVVNLIRKTVLKPSDDGPELLFQGNLSDFSISKIKRSKPRQRY